jgi:hypothetical protein
MEIKKKKLNYLLFIVLYGDSLMREWGQERVGSNLEL